MDSSHLKQTYSVYKLQRSFLFVSEHPVDEDPGAVEVDHADRHEEGVVLLLIYHLSPAGVYSLSPTTQTELVTQFTLRRGSITHYHTYIH